MIRRRRAVAIFNTTRDRKPATISPSAKIGSSSAGVVAGEPVRALVTALLDALATSAAGSGSVRVALNAAVGSRELYTPTTGDSGLTTGAGPVACAFVSIDVLACGRDADGIDDAALSCWALCPTGSSVVVGAGCGLTASIWICGKGVPMPLFIDIWASGEGAVL